MACMWWGGQTVSKREPRQLHEGLLCLRQGQRSGWRGTAELLHGMLDGPHGGHVRQLKPLLLHRATPKRCCCLQGTRRQPRRPVQRMSWRHPRAARLGGSGRMSHRRPSCAVARTRLVSCRNNPGESFIHLALLSFNIDLDFAIMQNGHAWHASARQNHCVACPF